MTHVEQRTPHGVVCGYLRLVGVSARKAMGLRAVLDDYCHRRGLLLAAVPTERVSSVCGQRSVAFTALLDVIAISEVVGVVLPSPEHLGPGQLAAEREQQIRAAGGEVFFVRSRNRTQALWRPGK
ncbi:hypothetical protein [Nonomuraea sp. NPDC049400]|uniref:hypothetical protein n=1 Tax=Nonomuraea sp. NPDC049400 TaxID=3364352 RepID=UPI00379E53F1